MDLLSGFKDCFMAKLDTNIVTCLVSPVSNTNLSKKLAKKDKKALDKL